MLNEGKQKSFHSFLEDGLRVLPAEVLPYHMPEGPYHTVIMIWLCLSNAPYNGSIKLLPTKAISHKGIIEIYHFKFSSLR